MTTNEPCRLPKVSEICMQRLKVDPKCRRLTVLTTRKGHTSYNEAKQLESHKVFNGDIVTSIIVVTSRVLIQKIRSHGLILPDPTTVQKIKLGSAVPIPLQYFVKPFQHD
eukprot:448585-Hanusia_phi.AAC.2